MGNDWVATSGWAIFTRFAEQPDEKPNPIPIVNRMIMSQRILIVCKMMFLTNEYNNLVTVLPTKQYSVILLFLLFGLFSSCNFIPPQSAPLSNNEIVLVSSSIPTSFTVASTNFTLKPTGIATAAPTILFTLTPSSTATPEDLPGCLEPVDDYTLVKANGYLLNTRTLKMLEHAYRLYDGEIEILGYAITQGSYTDSVSASFGTHAGGGAVDISVMRKNSYQILYDEIEPLIKALRLSGFAAWLRDFNELYPGSPIHIHAIAIGDKQLSEAAEQQLTGKFGYFWGYSGIPQKDGIPQPDRHGGPVVCRWMVETGYPEFTKH